MRPALCSFAIVVSLTVAACSKSTSSDSPTSPSSSGGSGTFTLSNARFESTSDVCPATPTDRPIAILVDVVNAAGGALTIDPGVIVHLNVTSSSFMATGSVYDGSYTGNTGVETITPSVVTSGLVTTIRLLEVNRCTFNFLGTRPNDFVEMTGSVFIQGSTPGGALRGTTLNTSNTFRLRGAV